jgi:hypothetical protein
VAKKKKAGRPVRIASGQPIALRLDASTLTRLDALAASMDADPAALVYGGQVSRSSALRLALLAGLDLLEKKRRAQ